MDRYREVLDNLRDAALSPRESQVLISGITWAATTGGGGLVIVITVELVAGVVTILTGLTGSHWWMYRRGEERGYAKAELEQRIAQLERELRDRTRVDRPHGRRKC